MFLMYMYVTTQLFIINLFAKQCLAGLHFSWKAFAWHFVHCRPTYDACDKAIDY